MIIIKDSIKKMGDLWIAESTGYNSLIIKINRNGLLTVNEGVTIHFSGYIDLVNPTIDQITDFINNRAYNITVE